MLCLANWWPQIVFFGEQNILVEGSVASSVIRFRPPDKMVSLSQSVSLFLQWWKEQGKRTQDCRESCWEYKSLESCRRVWAAGKCPLLVPEPRRRQNCRERHTWLWCNLPEWCVLKTPKLQRAVLRTKLHGTSVAEKYRAEPQEGDHQWGSSLKGKPRAAVDFCLISPRRFSLSSIHNLHEHRSGHPEWPAPGRTTSKH